MKCYTVTEKGVMPGIELGGKTPYPYVIVGDPNEQYDHRRVEVDGALAATASHRRSWPWRDGSRA